LKHSVISVSWTKWKKLAVIQHGSTSDENSERLVEELKYFELLLASLFIELCYLLPTDKFIWLEFSIAKQSLKIQKN